MPDDNSKGNTKGIEYFKSASMFISSVIIAATGIIATNQYNSGQLKIARNKELSELIPKLGNGDANVRKFSAVSLALYGKDAIPPLIATLADDDENVRTAGAKSLSIIGEPAISELKSAYENRRNDINLRASALYTLGLMRSQNAYKLAVSAVEDPTEDSTVRKDAANVLGFLRDQQAIGTLLTFLKTSKVRDKRLTIQILYALGEIQNVAITDDLINLLDHPAEDVRQATIWTLAKIGRENILNKLSQVESNDKSKKVRRAAKEASAWIKP